MNYRNVIKEILREYKLRLGIHEEVKVKVRNYKTRAAFCNIKTKTIYINKNLLDLDKDILEYLILHELLHIKLNSKYHSGEFYKILHEFASLNKIMCIRTKIREKLLQIQISNIKRVSSF
jgi:predicted metal-dependent hydrolase